MKQKHLITVKNVEKGTQWEEELTSMWVTGDSPHEPTHELGMHTIDEDLTEEHLDYYGKNIINYFNDTLRPNQAPREYVSSRIEVLT